MKYSFHPDARKEFNEAIEYYNERQQNLGLEFVKEVYNAIQLILKFPKAWTPFSMSTRQCMINRFPYGLIYQTERRRNIHNRCHTVEQRTNILA